MSDASTAAGGQPAASAAVRREESSGEHGAAAGFLLQSDLTDEPIMPAAAGSDPAQLFHSSIYAGRSSERASDASRGLSLRERAIQAQTGLVKMEGEPAVKSEPDVKQEFFTNVHKAARGSAAQTSVHDARERAEEQENADPQAAAASIETAVGQKRTRDTDTSQSAADFASQHEQYLLTELEEGNESETSADQEGYRQSVHQDPSTLTPPAEICVKGAQREAFKQHHKRLSDAKGFFDPERAARVIADGVIRARKTRKLLGDTLQPGFDEADYTACQQQRARLVEYTYNPKSQGAQLHKTVFDRIRHADKLQKLTELQKAPSRSAKRCPVHMRPFLTKDRRVYPSTSHTLEFRVCAKSTNPAEQLLFTDGVQDCVVLVGVDDYCKHGVVMAHVPCFVDLDTHTGINVFEEQWRLQNLQRFSSWTLFSNYRSLFAERLLRVVSKLHARDRMYAAPIHVDIPAHLVARHTRAHLRCEFGLIPKRYVKMYCDPSEHAQVKLQPEPRRIAVNSYTGDIYHW